MFVGFFPSRYFISNFSISGLTVMLSVIAATLSVCTYLGLVNPTIYALGQFLANDDRLEIWRFGLHIASNNFLVGLAQVGFRVTSQF